MPTVRLLAGLRGLVGASRLESDAKDVRGLLDGLRAKGDAALTGRLDSIDLRVLVNGRSILFLEGLDTKLAENDTVTLHLAGARGYPGG